VNVLVFDIETVPDVEGGRRLYGLEDLSDADVANAMFAKRRQDTEGKSDFLRHHLHRVVAIAAVLRREDRLNVWSLGEERSSESELINRFFEGIERFTPTLVSWNGGGFDLPVLHYRALVHGISAPRYWETGDDDASFRYNNYLNRFHYRHTDLMDILSAYQARATASLEEIATLIGLPGKLGMHGSEVWQHWQDGDLQGIRAYCETDVLNTYLIYLRYELMRGRLDRQTHQGECVRLREYLRSDGRAHFDAFLNAWSEQL
jgi:predicted PolB exonuclease-like 3'-5' exonuclease